MQTRRASSVASTSLRAHAGNGAKAMKDQLGVSAKAPKNPVPKTTEEREPRAYITSDEEEGEPSDLAGRSKFRPEHEHFGKCLILAIENKFHVVVEFLDVSLNYPEMNCSLAKYTPSILEIRGILWAYARKGKEDLGYCNSDGFVRGMDVRAYYNKTFRKEKAIIRYAGISGKDANAQFEQCATRVAGDIREYHFGYYNLASSAEIQNTGFEEVVRFFIRKKRFNAEERKRCSEAGSSAGIQTIKQTYQDEVETAAYLRIYFVHDTGSDRKENSPVLYEKESRDLADAVKLRKSSENALETQHTHASQNDGSHMVSAQSPANARRDPGTKTANSAGNKSVVAFKLAKKVTFGSGEPKPVPTESSIMDNTGSCSKPNSTGYTTRRSQQNKEGDSDSEQDMSDLHMFNHEGDSALGDSFPKTHPADETAGAHTAPPSPLEDDTDNDEDDGLGAEDGKGTKTKSVSCEMDATPELHGEDWEMYGAPYHVPVSAPVERWTKEEIAAKLRFYRDKKNIYAQKYSEFKTLVEVTIPRTAKQKSKKVEPADINFTFLAKNIVGQPHEKNYVPLTAKRRFFIDRDAYHKIMKGTHKFSTNPETVYRGVFWHELVSLPNKVKLATQKKDGQGFAGLFKDLYKEVWHFIKEVSVERTRAGVLPGSVWHVDNFPTKEVRNEIYRKEQTAFASKIKNFKKIKQKVELQKTHGGINTVDVDEEMD